MKSNLPHFVIARLGGNPAPGTHPDAELLTAFSEGALAGEERAELVAHLADCPDCRASLALAFGAGATVTALSTEPAPRSFQSWGWGWNRAPRWVFPALVTSAALVLVFTQNGDWEKTLLHADIRSVPVAPARAEAPPKAASSLAQTGLSIVDVRSELASRSAAKSPPGPGQMQKPQVPPFSPNQRSRGEIAVEEQHRQLQQSGQLVAGQVPISSQRRRDANTDNLRRARAPVADQALATVSQFRSANESLTFAEVPAHAGTSPTATVALKLVDEQGPTARQNAVQGQLHIQRLAPAVAFTARTAGATSTHDRWTIRYSTGPNGIAHGQVYKRNAGEPEWRAVPINSEVSLLTVNAVGTEVWVGGEGGTLFHSSDSGLQWERLGITTMAGKLTDSIVRIDARTPGRVQVTTGTGDVWSLENGLWRRNPD